ncbi:hypothetical protein PHYBOEH_005810 [Phytophthora boehmeriae]|uniref:Uncharacterized protein n=1 Tax=Phytophthora boehmeriae TaxID=109152 RepID=A0A8T1X3B1_9STRA|nr:hypothetical protein PHYBOEH_005810 [Phytophthora boehmeriae]
MGKGKQQQDVTPTREFEGGILSSGEGVATEGEEEEEASPMRESAPEYDGKGELTQDETQEIEDGREQLTPYVAKCYGHLDTLRKRKRQQEEQVETLVEESFGQIEAIMHEIMRGLQERHASSHTQFEASDKKLTSSLRAHNRMEKKLKMIAAILMREDDGEQEVDE